MAKKTKSISKAKKKPARAAKKVVKSKAVKTAGRGKSSARSAKPTARKVSKPKPKTMTVAQRIVALEEKIQNDKKELAALRKAQSPEEIADYVLKAHDGSQIRLSEMFGAHTDMILVHNMGKGCRYCTLWADGFTGFTKHLENRAAFVVVSKDPFDIQRDFYNSRGWNFRMYSSHGTTFNRDVSFETETGGQMPGVSAFYKDDNGRIFRTAYAYFGPGDDFCAVWPMLDLLKTGPDGWEPQYSY
ncbi:MAG: DUF899 family protein [Candidatus Zixiibacteriota bacterium]